MPRLMAMAALVIGACATAPAPVQQTDPNKVEVIARPATFYPEHVQITVGKTVVWRNVANIPHTITPDDPAKAGTWRTGKVESTGDTFVHTFNTPGRFRYNCAIHAGMVGTIHVQ